MQENPFKKNQKNYCTFYIVRHGETQFNIDGKIQGQGDSPLTDVGIKQVEEVAKDLKHVRFDGAFSSDLLRAKHTAEIILLEHKLAVKTTQLLRERKYAELEGKPVKALDDIHILFDKLTHEERFKHKISENIESDEEMVGRFITFLRETSVSHPGKTILVTTHGGMIRVLLVHLGFGTYKNLYTRSINNAAYVKLLSDGVEFFILETKGVTMAENIK